MTFRRGATGTIRALTDDAVQDGEEEDGEDGPYAGSTDIPNTQANEAPAMPGRRWAPVTEAKEEGGRWLETDDIEEF